MTEKAEGKDASETKECAEETEESATEPRGITGQVVRDLIEKTFLAGMGAAALTKDRLQELVEEFVKRGQLSSEEGRDVVDRVMTRSREEARTVLKKADSSLQSAYRDIGLTTKRELEDLDFRLRQLEMRVGLLEKAADTQAAPKEKRAD
jgi:polyhydroxyalkanoate synthesis regulator phasin